MPRPIPTWVTHFTRVEHLTSIIEGSLCCDRIAQESGWLEIEVGNASIKQRRLQRRIPVAPGGTVADYVPFYFAPRSPMMSAIAHGQVADYGEGTDRLVYLCTTVESLSSLGLEVVFSDRNAVLAVASFARWSDGEPEDDFIDWALMKETWWNNTQEHPDRRERRMAECLVFGQVPWSAFTYIGTKREAVRDEVVALLERDAESPRVGIRPGWYF